MFAEFFIKIMNKIGGPVSAALRKDPEMAGAKTEADILKAEEDFEKKRKRPAKEMKRK
jgi:hypothetical protein